MLIDLTTPMLLHVMNVIPLHTMEGRDLVDLVLAAQKGEAKASRALYERFQDALMGYCVLSTRGDRDQAKDVLQEIFIKVFKNLESLQNPERFSAWVWTIAHRECATLGKRSTRYNQLLEAFALDREVLLEADDKLAREHRIKAVEELLQGVEDPLLQSILTLKYTEPEHTTRDIAERLGVPHGTVTVKLMRFRRTIKRQMLSKLAHATKEKNS